MSIPISAIVITKNEEEMLPGCLESLMWADEVLVVDSFSTDSTRVIAEDMGSRVICHPFTNFAAQRNLAQTQARYDWVLFVDADERVSEKLRDAILDLARSERLAEHNAYYIPRANLFSGRWIPDPATYRFTPQLRKRVHKGAQRLFDRRLTVWERALHEVIRVPEPSGFIDGLLLHYSTTNLSRALMPLNLYTDLEAAQLHSTRHSPPSILEALARGARKSIYEYFFIGLWRYGEQGLVRAIMSGYSRFMDYAKLNERIRAQTGRGVWTERDLKFFTSFQVESQTGLEDSKE